MAHMLQAAHGKVAETWKQPQALRPEYTQTQRKMVAPPAPGLSAPARVSESLLTSLERFPCIVK